MISSNGPTLRYCGQWVFQSRMSSCRLGSPAEHQLDLLPTRLASRLLTWWMWAFTIFGSKLSAPWSRPRLLRQRRCLHTLAVRVCCLSTSLLSCLPVRSTVRVASLCALVTDYACTRAGYEVVPEDAPVEDYQYEGYYDETGAFVYYYAEQEAAATEADYSQPDATVLDQAQQQPEERPADVQSEPQSAYAATASAEIGDGQSAYAATATAEIGDGQSAYAATTASAEIGDGQSAYATTASAEIGNGLGGYTQ
jgi:hypothetical protein